MTPHRLAKQQHKHTRKSFWGTISERSIAVPLKAHANERATDTCCRHRHAEIRRIARPEYGLHGLRRNRCHPDECIDCGVCEPECPVEAIKPEAGAEKWLKLNADYAKSWPNITVKRDPPADSKEWEGKPDKLKYFSPNPGAGD